jgi:hypothetical protein
MSSYCRVWQNNGKCGDTLLGHFLEHFERIQLSTGGRHLLLELSMWEQTHWGRTSKKWDLEKEKFLFKSAELQRSEIWKKKNFYSNLLNFIAIQHHNNKKGLAVGVGDCVCCVSTVHCTRELCVGNSVAHLAATQSLPTLDSWIQMLPSSILGVVIQYHLPAPLWTCDLSVKAYGSLCWKFQFFQVTCHCVGLARMLSLFGLHPIQFWAH